ncbi:MAG: M67 family metallopeptidase [Thermoplasmata archaeon]|nr:M67 family metallopeptidase [Thermoplasmata archaeon]
MSDLWLPPEALVALRAHAERDYPEECCGFLVGEVDPSTQHRTVHRALAARNRVSEDRERRFAIVPQDLADLEERLEPEGLTVLGFYHSHPDHPALPSSFDTEHAWPWYTYLIVRVVAGQASEMGCFELDPDRREFRSVRAVTLERPLPPASHPPTTSAVSGKA